MQFEHLWFLRNISRRYNPGVRTYSIKRYARTTNARDISDIFDKSEMCAKLIYKFYI